jgi:soluble P-type ATPase
MPLVVPVPGRKPLAFHTVALDFTGTLAKDGALLAGVSGRLRRLARRLRVVVMSADTFGTVRKALSRLPVEVRVVATGRDKARLVEGYGAEGVVAIGNGRNDIPMVRRAGLGIAVVGPEGAATGLLAVADLIARDIREALDLLENPLRLVAGLRE